VRSQTAHRGFTLIEILVAVTLIGIVVSIVYGSMAATTRSAQACRDKLSVSTPCHLALQQIAAAIRCGSKELRTQDSGLRIRTTKPLLDDSSSQEGAFDVILQWDGATDTIRVCQQSWRPRLSLDANPPEWQPLLDHVVGLQWSFWDGTVWKTDWDSQTEKALPLLVRIDLTSQDDHDRRYDLQTLVSPSCTTQALSAVNDANRPTKP
jgi:prepilin-type N-terminal cleavage/methylation domain-containing protein